ncbi:MAG: hypothetical protein WDA06_05815 [Phenylobacterium sp.]
MSISKDNVLFVYNKEIAESYTLAISYQIKYGLDIEQILGINCGTDEILNDYSSFQTLVEDPIRAYISTLSREVTVIVLGYMVTGGFYDGLDIISSTSRLARINHAFSKQKANFLYDRQVFSRYSDDDADFAIVVSRIDAPTYAVAKRMIDDGEKLVKQEKINGKFFFDPVTTSSKSGSYVLDLSDFYIKTLFNLNLTVCSTSYVSPYVDVVIPKLKYDSFYWGIFNDRSSNSFFSSTDTDRIFFYNADYDSCVTMRSVAAGNWGPLSVNNGYTSCAGSMSNPTNDGYLRPKPFFEALYQGTTLGEAYIFASPYLDWTNTLIGDPLIRVRFPGDPLSVYIPDGTGREVDENEDERLDTFVDKHELWYDLIKELSESIGYYINEENLVYNLLYNIVMSTDIATEISLLQPAYDLYKTTNENTRFSTFYALAKGLLNFAKEELINDYNKTNLPISTLNEYLTGRNIRISRLLLPYLSNENISSANLFDEGYWDIEHTVVNSALDVTYYNFILKIYSDENLSNLLYSFDSETSLDGWLYEEEGGKFSPFTQFGVHSKYVGRRVKYVCASSSYLARGQVFYYDIMQKSPYGSWVSDATEGVVFT